MEKEIAVLESQANPLDTAASESRVRRLALLKRNRRAAAEMEKRRGELSAKLETCALALQNLKFDLLRMKSGTQTWQHVTSVAEQAMALAREVDSVVYVGDAMARLERPALRGHRGAERRVRRGAVRRHAEPDRSGWPSEDRHGPHDNAGESEEYAEHMEQF